MPCKVQLSFLQQQTGLEEGGDSDSLEKVPARWWTVRFNLCPAVRVVSACFSCLCQPRSVSPQNEDLGCRIDLCSLTIAGWLWHGDGTSFLLTFEICLKTGNLSRDKPKVVVGVSTEDGNRNYISASTISLFKALCQLYLINLQDSTAIQGNRDH